MLAEALEACLSSSLLGELAHGRLPHPQQRSVFGHLDGCTSCYAVLLALAPEPTVGPATFTTAATVVSVPSLRCGWSPPARLEEFTLVHAIGRGSGGEVWLAHDNQLDRQVAIKFGSPSALGSGDRFRREARAIARVSHPNVLIVHRVGEIDDRPYLVTELVQGQSLEQLEKPVARPRVLAIALGLARGLAAAHRAGVLHRDIKPANAMLGDDGSVKLLDFGLAKLIGRDTVDPEPASAACSTAQTTIGQIVGTPLYMAPEALDGAAATAPMDVYSLGAVLYELCAGGPPHQGPTLAALRHDVQSRDPAPLVGVDAALAAVVMRCLQRDPAARWASGEELCQALDMLVLRGSENEDGRPPE